MKTNRRQYSNAAASVLRITPVALAVALATQPATSATRTWDGSAGTASPYWDLVTNWSTDVAPVAGDIVNLKAFDTTFRTGTLALTSFTGTKTLTVAGGTLAFQAASSIGNLVFSGGTLGGTGTLTAGTFAWNGTSYLGYSVLPNMTLNVSGAATLDSGFHSLNYGQTLNLNGDSTWNESGRIYFYDAGSTVNLAAGKTLTLNSSSAAYYQIDGAGTFNNAGTLTKNGTGNILYIDANFNNTGTLNVNEGEVDMRYGDRVIGGTFNVANGATFRLNSNSTFTYASGVAIGGAGDVIFEGGGSHLVVSGSRTFGGGGTKTLTGGVLGGAGTMVFDNLTWTGGTMGAAGSPGGVTTVNGPATLSATTHYLNYGRTLNLNGDTTWDANARIYFYDGASVVNLKAGKTLSLAGNASSYDQIYGGGTFNNAGTITKSGTGIFYIDSTFNNTGTVNVNRGEVQFRNTRTLGGKIAVGSGATLHFASGSFTTFQPSIAITGAGNLTFEGTNIFTSTENFAGGGIKTLNGTLGGSGSVKFDNLTWLGGTMGVTSSVGGVTTVTGATTLSDGTHYVNYGQTLNLNGGGTWDANGGLYIYGAGTGYGQSVVNLAAGKTLSLAGNASSYDQIYGPGIFNNAGTVTKSGTGAFYIDSNFNNTGTLNGNKGVTYIRGIFNNTGTLSANGGRIEVTTTAGLPQWDLTTQTLNAGTYRVTGIQPIALTLGYVPSTSTPALIKTNKANIVLTGAGAAILTETPNPGVNALTALATNSGTLSLLGGATLATTVALKNSATGVLTVGNGSTLTVGASGLYRQSDTASTFLGGTLAVKSFAWDAGSLSSGNGAGLIGSGVLSATGTGVTMGALAKYNEDLTTAGFDTLLVKTGNVVLDGTLTATFGAGMGAGTYRFLTTDTGTISNTFTSVVSNLSASQFNVVAVYGAKFVDLKVTAKTLSSPVSAVPEPETYAMFASGLALLGWQLRRRRSATKC